jgi:hypothetical protein
VAFAEGRDPKQVTESIERHGIPPAACGSPRASRGQMAARRPQPATNIPLARLPIAQGDLPFTIIRDG